LIGVTGFVGGGKDRIGLGGLDDVLAEQLQNFVSGEVSRRQRRGKLGDDEAPMSVLARRVGG